MATPVGALSIDLSLNSAAFRRGVDQLVAAGWFTKSGDVVDLAEGR